MADCTGLENRRAERYRGFESPPLRVQSDGRCKHLKYSALQRPFFIDALDYVKTVSCGLFPVDFRVAGNLRATVLSRHRNDTSGYRRLSVNSPIFLVCIKF